MDCIPCIIIDHEAREIIHLVASVCPFVFLCLTSKPFVFVCNQRVAFTIKSLTQPSITLNDHDVFQKHQRLHSVRRWTNGQMDGWTDATNNLTGGITGTDMFGAIRDDIIISDHATDERCFCCSSEPKINIKCLQTDGRTNGQALPKVISPCYVVNRNCNSFTGKDSRGPVF